MMNKVNSFLSMEVTEKKKYDKHETKKQTYEAAQKCENERSREDFNKTSIT
jgi:hypothetical protein